MAVREPGFYWVKERTVSVLKNPDGTYQDSFEWVIAYWGGNGWSFIGDDGTATDDPSEVDELRIVRK